MKKLNLLFILLSLSTTATETVSPSSSTSYVSDLKITTTLEALEVVKEERVESITNPNTLFNPTNLRNILLDIPDTTNLRRNFDLGTLFRSGWSGNGGDSHHLQDNIWYLGEKTVSYCVKVGADSIVNKYEASKMIRESFTEWKSFFNKYSMLEKPLKANRRRANLAFPDGLKRSMTSNFKEVSCNELKKSKKGEELVFLIGKSNALIDLYKDLATENAYGLALRKGYNHTTYRNSGFVWTSPEIKDVEVLKHVVLHEIGHVFGMKHDSVHVMDEDLVDFLEAKRKHSKANLGVIESKSWKYRLVEGQNNLLSKKGKKPRRRACSVGLIKNSSIPKIARKKLGMKSYGCSKLELKVDEILGAKKFHLTLILNQAAARSKNMSGLFKSSRTKPRDSMSPGVFTKLTNVDATRPRRKNVHRRIVVDGLFDLPARGSFKLGNSEFPARISYDKGLVVELNFGSNKWWVVGQ
ncbi:hypothetical protein A9Q84_17160 [Halobacteriovorax marinus]|uniref:Peptidase M10 metallopeptidase domain-containing protein n=1 Tax=Halobacteriovorax marinus TaxID=97084 RepID=A0A1Y5FA24_9BACT|nr:hypothetical protein A9Q84_17160 [Halobacteriovorax marinus]